MISELCFYFCLLAGLSAFIVMIAKVIGSCMAVILVEKCGRKLLLLSSQIMAVVTLFPVGAYFYLQEHSCLDNNAKPVSSKVFFDKSHPYVYAKCIFQRCLEDEQKFAKNTVESFAWMPLFSLILYMISYAMGWYTEFICLSIPVEPF